MFKILRFISREFLITIFNSLSYVIPKDPNTICFLSLHKRDSYSGNLKYLFEEMVHSRTLLRPIWLARTVETRAALSRHGLPYVYHPFFPYWTLLRATMIAVDTSGGRFCGNFKLIQVWHGTGFKNIGRLQKNRKKPASFWPSEDKNYAIFVATSEQDQIRKKASFPAAHVLITGAPRNDLLFRDQRSSSSLLKRLQVNPGTTIFLYAPTFRDHETAIPLSIDEINYLSRILSDINGIMLFKNHPYAKPLQIPKEAAAVRDISDESKIDLQELLLISHVLISDYSGIVTDFAITGRPMIFYWPDYAEYISNCRDFYYDMKEILPGPFAHNASRLAELMKNLDWSSEPTYREKYLAFLNHFHHYQDDQSARRLRLEVERVNF